MAYTLPDKKRLGPAIGLQPRGMVQAPRDFIAPALQRAGAGLQELGGDIAAVQAQERQQGNVVDVTRANALIATRTDEIEREFNNDGDFATYDARLKPKLDALGKEATGLIRDPQARALFGERLATTFGSTRNKVLARGDALRKDADTVGLDQSLDGLKNVYADPSKPEADRAKARRDMESGIDHAEKSGLWTPSQAQQRREAYLRGGDYAYGQRMVRENPDLVPALRPSRSGAPADYLRYSNQNATRSRPLSSRLSGSLSFLKDMGVTAEVFSGGQPSAAEGGARTGSTRHDDGDAADVFFYKDGRKLDWANDADRPIFQEIVRKGRAAGLTGFGAGPGYMQAGSMHVGFGKPGVWGAGGSGAAAPMWLRQAFGDPRSAPRNDGPATEAAVPSGGRSRVLGYLSRGSAISFYYREATGLPDFVGAALGGHALQENFGRSTGRPGDNGTAFGTFQWRGKRLDNLKAYAAQNGADWRDQKVQLDFAREEGDPASKYADQGAVRAWRELKGARTVDDAVAAFMHFERPQGYTADNPRAGHGYAKRLNYARQLMGQAGGELEAGGSDRLDEIVVAGRAPAAPVILPDWYNRLTPEQQISIQGLGDSVRSERRVALKSDIEAYEADAPAALQRTGGYDGRHYSEDDYIAAYGEDGPSRYDANEAKLDVAKTAFDMRSMPAAEIQRAVEDAAPTATGAGAALQAARYEALEKAAAAVLKARATDPAGYVQQAFPNVGAAWEASAAAPNDPAAFSRALRLTSQAQTSLGVLPAQQQLLPKAVAERVVDVFKADGDADQRLAAVAQTVFAAGDPAQRRQVMRQLIKAGVPASIESVLEAQARNDPAAARELLFATLVDPDKIPGKSRETDATIKQSIQDNLMSPGQVGDVAFGLSLGAPQNGERATADAELMVRAVKVRLGKGQDLATAVAGVGKAMFGDVEVFNPWGSVSAQILVPKDFDTAPLKRGLEALTPKVREALAARARIAADNAARRSPDAFKAADGSRAVLDAASANRVDAIVNEGVWRSVGDNRLGFVDSYTGLLVVGPDGEPVTFAFDDAIKAGQGGPREFGEPYSGSAPPSWLGAAP